MMYRIFISLAILFAATPAIAQRIDNFKRQLAVPDTLHRSVVRVTEDSAVAEAVRISQNMRQNDYISGYRVSIFFDNSQNARNTAGAILTRFREEYPGIPAYMTYKNPYFKVTVGNCVTAEEAIILWGRIKNSFDRAYVVKEDIPLGSLTD